MTSSEKGWLKRRDETLNVSVPSPAPSTPGHAFATRSYGQMTVPREKPRETAACAARQRKEIEEDESMKPQDDDPLGALLRRLQVEWENASVALGYGRLGAPVHGVWAASADASQLSSSRLRQSSSRCVLPPCQASCVDALDVNRAQALFWLPTLRPSPLLLFSSYPLSSARSLPRSLDL
jgi:hypothetical protein